MQWSATRAKVSLFTTTKEDDMLASFAGFNRAQARYDAMEPEDDGAWEAFAEYCDAEGLNADDEDFDAWLEGDAEDAALARAEARADEAEDNARRGW